MQKMSFNKIKIDVGYPKNFDAIEVGMELAAECGFDTNALLEVIEYSLEGMLYNPDNDPSIVPASYDDIKAAYDLVSKASKISQYK